MRIIHRWRKTSGFSVLKGFRKLAGLLALLGSTALGASSACGQEAQGRAFLFSETAALVGLLGSSSDIFVTFDPPSLPGGSRGISSYSQNGVNFNRTSSMAAHTDTGLTRRPNNGSAFLSLLWDCNDWYFDMGGAAFSVKQVDLAEYSTVFQMSNTVTFVGRKVGGSSVSASFVTDGVIDGTGSLADFQTFYFPATFENLVRVNITTPRCSIDNLILSTGTVSNVSLVTEGNPARHGNPLPSGYGTMTVASGSIVTNRVEALADEASGVRYACRGWTGSGSVPASGLANVVSAVLAQNSTLTWQWQTQYHLTARAEGAGYVTPTNLWVNADSNIVVAAFAATNAIFSGWSGDTNGCVVSGATIQVPMTQARSVVALFAPASAPSQNGLVLWNRLGSESEVLNSEVGTNGLASAGAFVPGVFGNAFELSSQAIQGVTFPIGVIPRSAGCIEFWARVEGVSGALPWGNSVALYTWMTAQGAVYPVMGFNGNDGMGNGGLCGYVWGLGSTGTGMYGSWTYASALKGASHTNWHHYALSWSIDGLAGLTNPVRRVAVYVDGALNSGWWIYVNDQPEPAAVPEGGRIGLLYLLDVPSARAAVDNVKVWSYAKTDFRDRFTEDAGCVPQYQLRVAGARGEASPTNGVYTHAEGTAVSASVPQVVEDGTARYVCAGATVAGNAFVQNADALVSLTLTNNAVLTWNWRAQYLLDAAVEGTGTVTAASGWYENGTNVVLVAAAEAGWIFAGWSGDTNGCLVSGTTIQVPMTQARSVVALFARASAPSQNGLVLWNRLGSEAEIRNSEVGSNGLASAGAFVPGVFGNAFELSSQAAQGVTFPIGVIPRTAGCVEFWARVEGVSGALPWGNRVSLYTWMTAQGAIYPVMGFNGNDGMGNGGLCGYVWGLGSTGTGMYGSWTYASALKGASHTNWHHYALSWSIDGLAGLTNPVRRVAVYVDGALNSGYWVYINDPPEPAAVPEGGRIGLLYLLDVPSARAAVDNVKVWSYAKTDFSDRFTEDAGYVPQYRLSVSGARGEASPTNGVYTHAEGTAVSASVPQVVEDGTARYVCAGAAVTGNAFVQNADAQVSLTLTNNAVLTWNWRTQYLLAAAVEGTGTVTEASGWYENGTNVVLAAAAEAGWIFAGWSGDTNGCVVTGASITVPMTQARSVVAVFTPPVFQDFATFARDPANAALNYARVSGSWSYSSVVGGLSCLSPAKRGRAVVQVTVNGPGLLSFEWALTGADGTNAIICSVGSKTRCVKSSERPETITVAVPAGRQNVRWTVSRGPHSPEVSGILRQVAWTPLAKAADPLPRDGQVTVERLFSGLSWSGDADFFRVYAGHSATSLRPVGAGTYAGRSVPSEDMQPLVAEAAGRSLYWRVDVVRRDVFGGEAVRVGSVRSFAVVPQNAPEFLSGAAAAAELVVGVRSTVGPFAFGCGLDGTVGCEVASGSLPPGLKASVGDGAVSLSGVPLQAGRYVCVLQLSLKRHSRDKVPGTSLTLDLSVVPLGLAAGAFDGWVDGSRFGSGAAEMSVTGRGKVTGKFSLLGTNYTFKAGSYDGTTNGCCVLRAVAMRGARPAFPVEIAVDQVEGRVLAALPDEPAAGFALFRDSWKLPGVGALLSLCEGSYPIAWGEANSATLTVRPNGKVRLVGKVSGRSFTSADTLLWLPGDMPSDDRCLALIYAPPQARGRSNGVFGVVEIVSDPDGLEPNAIIEVLPLRDL